MLVGKLGIRLILLMGESVPLPAPYDVIKAVQSVEVTNDAESGDGFQMSLSLVKEKTLDYGLSRTKALKLGTRVALAGAGGALPGLVPSSARTAALPALFWRCILHTDEWQLSFSLDARSFRSAAMMVTLAWALIALISRSGSGSSNLAMSSMAAASRRRWRSRLNGLVSSSASSVAAKRVVNRPEYLPCLMALSFPGGCTHWVGGADAGHLHVYAAVEVAA